MGLKRVFHKVLLGAFLFLMASGSVFSAESKEILKKSIVIGATVGDFAEMVSDQIKPQLEKKGYKVRLVQFTDYYQPNIALEEKSLDANLFQHKPYLEEFIQAKNLHLSTLVAVPTAPLGVYGGKKKLLKEIAQGDTVAVANDPTNQARGLQLLESLGWIELKKGKGTIQLGLKDIEKNPHELKVIQLEAAQIPRALSSVAFAVINGNYAKSSGISLDSALEQEKGFTYINWIVVRSEDSKAAFANDLVEVIHSPEFKAYSKKAFHGYKFPEEWE